MTTLEKPSGDATPWDGNDNPGIPSDPPDPHVSAWHRARAHLVRTSVVLTRVVHPRNFTGVRLSDRIVAAVLVSITALTLSLLGMLIFGHGPLRLHASSTTKVVALLLTTGGAGIATAILAGTVRTSDFSIGPPAKVMTHLVRLLPMTGLIVLVMTIMCLDETRRVSSHPGWILIRATLWTGLAVSCIYVLRPRRPKYMGTVDIDLVARVGLPLTVIMVAVAAIPLVGFRPATISVLLKPPSSFIAVALYPIFLGLFIIGTIKGLSATRDRGERLSRYVGERHGRVGALLITKLLVLLVFCVILHLNHVDTSPFSWTLSAWVYAVAAAVVGIFLFVVDDRISLTKADYRTVASSAPFVVPGAVGCVFFVAIALGLVIGCALNRPWALVAAVVMFALAVVPRYVTLRPITGLIYGAAVVAAVVGANIFGSVPPFFATVYAASERDLAVLVGIAVLVAVIATIGGFGWVIVRSFRRRQFGLATFLTTVVVWVVLLQAWSTTAAPIRWTQFDLVLTGIMVVLTVASIAGFRHAVDPVEMVVAATVTFFLIEWSSMSDLLPRYVKTLPLLLAVLGPGLVAVWRGLDALRHKADRRKAVVQLATTAMVYEGIALYVMANKLNVSNFADTISKVILGFISIPLILLLIAAREPSAARHRARA